MTDSPQHIRQPGKVSTLPVFLVILLDMIGFGILLPSLPFLNQELQGDPAVLGWIIAAFSIGQFLAAPIMGRISDQIGRKPVLAWTVGIGIVGNLAYAWASSVFILALSRFIAGIAAGNLSVARAYITEVTPPEKRTAAMGMIGAAFGLGFTIGPGIGALLAGWGLRSPGYVSAALGVLNLILLLIRMQEPAHIAPVDTAARSVRPGKAAWIVIVMYVAAITGFAGFETVGALVTQAAFGWGHRENGYLFAGAGVLAVLIQGGLIRPLSRRLPDTAILFAGYLMMGTGFVVLAQPELELRVFLFGAVLVGSGISFSQPSLFALYSRVTDPGGQGMAMGWLHAGGSLARMVGPIWAGMAYAAGGNRYTFAGTSGAMLATIILLVLSVPVLRNHAQLIKQARGS